MQNKHKIIADLYDEENYNGKNEAFSMKVSFSGSISDVTLVDAIASRFGTTRTAILSELLHDAAHEMFFSLSLKDKKSVAEAADLETTRILTKNGVKQTTVGLGADGETNEDLTWRGYAALVERDLAKKGGDKDADS